MDPAPYLELKPAPRIVFDSLPARADKTRFVIPAGDDVRRINWQEYADGIRDVALHLNDAGLQRGERVAIYAPNSVQWITAALGVQAAGGAMVPIYAHSTAEQAAYVIEHCDARFVFVATAPLVGRLLAAWPRLGGVERIFLMDDGIQQVPSMLTDLALEADDATKAILPAAKEASDRMRNWSQLRVFGAMRHAVSPLTLQTLLDDLGLDDLALMLYTSGTSGQPKGVPLTHRNVAANGSDWLRCNAPLLGEPDEDPDVDLLWLPMSHIFGFGEACLGNTLGFESWLCEPLEVFAKLPSVRPTVFMSVPTLFEKLATASQSAGEGEVARQRLDAMTGGRFRFLLSGGAGLDPAIKRWFHDQGLLIIEGYGLTEAAPTLTLNRPDAFRFDSVGKPLPSVTIKLADDGEILASGPNIFSGYHKDPAASAEALTEDGWLRTGDIGQWTEDGFLRIVDRKKDILVLASGKNVPPANIEQRFAADDLIAQAVVYGDGKRYLVAGLWLEATAFAAWCAVQDASNGDLAGLLQAELNKRVERVNAGLARHETIKRFAIMTPELTIDGGHLTATMKVRRKQVVAEFGHQFEALYA